MIATTILAAFGLLLSGFLGIAWWVVTGDFTHLSQGTLYFRIAVFMTGLLAFIGLVMDGGYVNGD